MSWYSTLATSYHACEFATSSSTFATISRMPLDMVHQSQYRFSYRPCMNAFVPQVSVVHSWKLLHPQQGNCCQRHPERPCGAVQGCAASHQRSFPAQLSLPGQLHTSVAYISNTQDTAMGQSKLSSLFMLQHHWLLAAKNSQRPTNCCLSLAVTHHL
jgi:hypothetical protein